MADNQPSIELSERELQVLQLVVTGASNQEIARKLVISINTVKVHLRNIFNKLEVQSRTEATLRAIKEGLVTVTEEQVEAAEADEASTPALRTHLIEAAPPLVLPRWRQVYLVASLLFALMVASLPLIPSESAGTNTELLPSIYRLPATPAPPATSSRWRNHAPLPSARAGLALVALDQQLFAIGGTKKSSGPTRLVEIYDPMSNLWTEGASKPTATADVTGEILNGKIYIPGGCTEQAQAVDVLEIYDPQADDWATGPPLPEARCGYGLAAFQDNLYLFGGWNGQTFEDTIFIFSPAEDRWDISEHRLPQPLGYTGVAVLDETIYMVGGYNGQEEFDTTYAFLPRTGEWREKARLNEKRGGLGLVSTSKTLYAIGGGWDHALNSSEKYDPVTDAWTIFETPTTGQWRNLGLAIVNNSIYAVGGWDGTEATFMDEVVSYQFLYQLFIPVSSSSEKPVEK
jgi:DNA-binding CsgD family transcriptional regulator/N-acetylneuraminic acid mutarotase